jgi:hypothetical protein
MRTLLHLVWSLCLITVLSVCDLAARPRTFVAGQSVRIKVDVPAGYSFKSETNSEGMTRVLMENPVWNIKIAVLISPEYSAESESEEWQRNLVVSQSADYLSQSKEQDYNFLPLKPANGSGVYCVFTDAEAKRVEDLKPGEAMHIVVGTKVIRGAVMYFQILNNDVKSPEYLEVFNLFVSWFDEA